MRLWIISCLLLCMLYSEAHADSAVEEYGSLELAMAPTLAVDDSIIGLQDSVIRKKIENYERRLEKYHRFFQALVPDFVRFQYAGSIGLLNAGCGWSYGKNHQHETDIMLGYIPKYDKESALMAFTVRQTYIPWVKPLYGRLFSFQPLSCGVFVNSVLNSEYWTREPDRYPNANYYRFSSKIRFHCFFGQRYTLHIPEYKRKLARQVSVVWELSTCDLYIVSKAINKTLPWHEMLSLSFGLKYDF